MYGCQIVLLCKVTKKGPLNQPCCSDTFKASAFIELFHHPPVKVICCSLSTPPTHQGEKKKRKQDPYLQEHFSDLLKEYAQTSLKATLRVWGFWCGWVFMSYIGPAEVENAKFSNKN